MAGVFVYDALAPGGARWGILHDLRDHSMPPVRDSVNGQLFDTGLGKVAGVINSADTFIPGYTVSLANPVVGLEILDAVEGVKHGLFERVLVMTKGRLLVWAYNWAHPTDHFKPIGIHETMG